MPTRIHDDPQRVGATADAASPRAESGETTCDLCGSANREFLFSAYDGDYVECRDCTLIYSIAEEEGLAADYDATYARRLPDSPVARDRSKKWEKKAAERIASFEPYRSTGRILEIGCSNGDFLECVGSRWQAVGVELSDVAASYCRKRGLDARTGTIEDTAHDLPAAGFDVVWAANLIEHVISPMDFLHTVSGLIRPGGLLIASTLNADSWAFKLARGDWQYANSARAHRFIFTPATLQRYCASAGLEIVKTSTVGFRFVSKFEPRSWFNRPLRTAEQLVETLSRAVNKGHRIEIRAEKTP